MAPQRIIAMAIGAACIVAMVVVAVILSRAPSVDLPQEAEFFLSSPRISLTSGDFPPKASETKPRPSIRIPAFSTLAPAATSTARSAFAAFGSPSDITQSRDQGASLKLEWERFLKPVLNYDCENNRRISPENLTRLTQMDFEVDMTPANLLFYRERESVNGTFCAVVKSVPSSYLVSGYSDCKYNLKLLLDYYIRVPNLEFPRADNVDWGIDPTVAAHAEDCQSVVAVKQCKELPEHKYFGIC